MNLKKATNLQFFFATNKQALDFKINPSFNLLLNTAVLSMKFFNK